MWGLDREGGNKDDAKVLIPNDRMMIHKATSFEKMKNYIWICAIRKDVSTKQLHIEWLWECWDFRKENVSGKKDLGIISIEVVLETIMSFSLTGL